MNSNRRVEERNYRSNRCFKNRDCSFESRDRRHNSSERSKRRRHESPEPSHKSPDRGYGSSKRSHDSPGANHRSREWDSDSRKRGHESPGPNYKLTDWALDKSPRWDYESGKRGYESPGPNYKLTDWAYESREPGRESPGSNFKSPDWSRESRTRDHESPGPIYKSPDWDSVSRERGYEFSIQSLGSPSQNYERPGGSNLQYDSITNMQGGNYEEASLSNFRQNLLITHNEAFNSPPLSIPRMRKRFERVGGGIPISPPERLIHYSERCKIPPPNEESNKNSIVLPRRGMPGGLDDPLRRGLSGSGVKWYIRFLNEGFPPEEARKKAGERKKNPPKNILGQPSGTAVCTTNAANRSGYESRLAGKKAVHGLEKKESNERGVKRRRLSGAMRKKIVRQRQRPYLDKSILTLGKTETPLISPKDKKIAILPKGFPAVALSSKNLRRIEHVLIEEMSSWHGHKLQFGGINFLDGMMIVDCVTPESSQWLQGIVPRLRGLYGLELTTCAEEDIPKGCMATFFFPKSQRMTEKKLLEMLAAQNEGLQISQWKVIDLKYENNGQELKVELDKESSKTLKDNGYSFHFGFGKYSCKVTQI